MQMVGFEASFGRRRLIKQALKHAPRNPHDALILADPDAELDRCRSLFQRAASGKLKNMVVLHRVVPGVPDACDPESKAGSTAQLFRAGH
jgi:hypothetical protein